MQEHCNGHHLKFHFMEGVLENFRILSHFLISESELTKCEESLLSRIALGNSFQPYDVTTTNTNDLAIT